MDTSKLRKFAQFACRQLHKEVAAKLERVLTTDSSELRAKAATLNQLKDQIKTSSKQTVAEQVAYTWFNRFCALRYMDVNAYTRIGVVSPARGQFQPEILQEAKQGVFDQDVEPFVNREQISGLLSGLIPATNGQQEAYRLLVVGVCNAYHEAMPFLFEPIDDYTELLMPDDLLSSSSILAYVRESMTPDVCKDVEVIGWLYQFYISEKKDQVFASKKKIVAADIPAATQLFTPHWIVRYLVENSLGRLWMLNRPNSRLVERMEYYIASEETKDGGRKTNVEPLDTNYGSRITDHDFLRISSPEEIRLCDPAAGSGHMLTYAFDLLYAIYEEEGYAPSDIPRLILTKNLYGMEIDERAAALAAFALTMKARAKDRRFLSRSTNDVRSGRSSIRPNICVLHPLPLTEKEIAPDLPALVSAIEALDAPHNSPPAPRNSQLAIRNSLLHDLTLFPHADNFGSLLRPQLAADQIHAARTALDAAPAGQLDWTRQTVRDQMRQALDQAEYLARKYHVVVANPPYMGGGNANDELKNFAQKEYPDSKADLFAMFIERNLELAQHNGMVAMITMQSWMFLSSYEKLREKLLERDTILSMAHLGARAFDTIGGEVVSTTAFVLEKAKRPTYKGTYLRLIDGNSEAEKAEMFRANLTTKNRPLKTDLYRAAAVDFKKIPGSPIAYWVSEQGIEAFRYGVKLADVAEPRVGLDTGDNDKFIRLWFEVEFAEIGFGFSDSSNFLGSGYHYVPHTKGGTFRKWYGNFEYVLRFDPKSYEELANSGNHLPSRQYYFQEGANWTRISSAKFGIRFTPIGFVFNSACPTIFGDHETILEILGFLLAPNSAYFLSALSPTVNYQAGEIRKLPLIDMSDTKIKNIVSILIHLSRSDWDSYETSWDFTDLPLLRAEFRGETLAATYAALRAHWRDNTLEMQRLETENNRIFIDAYGLQAELTPEVPLAEITLTCNPYYRYSGQLSVDSSQWESLRRQSSVVCRQLEAIADELAAQAGVAVTPSQRLGLEQRLLADTVREFISYAVGCLFGRYSLDKPGLILANQGEGVEEYVRKVTGDWGSGTGDWVAGQSHETRSLGQRPSSQSPVPSPLSLVPDADNVIPILDGDWFADDISERFKHFLRVTFGEAHYSDNLRFVEEALGRDVRSYFLRDFYDDHVRRYQKRPIYWLFSSPKGSFNALVYMHRYRPHTVSVVLNDYLRELRAKLNARKRHLEAVSISAGAAARDKTAALKESDKIDKVLAELQEYEDDVLYPLATRQVEIDLDDGVKVNYNKLGGALKKITGLSD